MAVNFQYNEIKISSPLESNGGIPVNLQDQTSRLIDSLFNKSISNFTIAVDTPASTETSLVYDFVATVGHGIAIGMELLLIDVTADIAFQCVAVGVSVNTISIDRPIDHVFPAASSLGRIVTSNMNVDGSSTPQIFTFRAGVAPVDITRILLTIHSSGATAPNDGLFGNKAALTRGIVLRIFNGAKETVFNFKTNGDIKKWCYDVNYAGAPPTGKQGVSSRITFGGQSKHGVVVRISGADRIQWIVQDNLTDQDLVDCALEGHEVTD